MAADRAADGVSAEDVGADEVSAAKPDAEKPADTADAATADDAAAGEADAARQPGLFAGGGGVPVLVTLIVLVVGALVAVGFLAAQSRAAASERENRAEALRVARQLTVNFTTLDYRSFDTDMKRVQQLAAGDLAKQSSNVFAELRKLLAENKMVANGTVLEAGLVSFDQDSARALVVADGKVSNVLTKQPEVRHYRFQLDLSKEPEGWRVVDLQVVG
jgi:Mce-associated membrane protein